MIYKSLPCSVIKRINLSVSLTKFFMPALADNFIIFNYHAADQRIWRCKAHAALRKLKRPPHIKLINIII